MTNEQLHKQIEVTIPDIKESIKVAVSQNAEVYQTIINAKVEELLSCEYIIKEIEKQVEKTMRQAIKEIGGSYILKRHFEKAIEQSIKNTMSKKTDDIGETE